MKPGGLLYQPSVLVFETETLTESWARLAASKSQQSSCLHFPQCWGHTHLWGHPRLFRWVLGSELGSSGLCRWCSYPLSHPSSPGMRILGRSLTGSLTALLQLIDWHIEWLLWSLCQAVPTCVISCWILSSFFFIQVNIFNLETMSNFCSVAI